MIIKIDFPEGDDVEGKMDVHLDHLIEMIKGGCICGQLVGDDCTGWWELLDSNQNNDND